MSYAIQVQGLRKSYRGQEAVKGIEFEVRKGELLALLGPNGAGKTTTIHMLSTLLPPDGGSDWIAGFDVVKQPKEVRARISLTGQFAALDEGLTGLQNLRMIAGLHAYSAKEAREIADHLLESFSLAEAGNRIVKGYSGGMRRRLDIAAGIVSRPEILFLDEHRRVGSKEVAAMNTNGIGSPPLSVKNRRQDAVRYLTALVVILAAGWLLGFRPDGGIQGAALALLLTALFAFAVSWVFSMIGVIAKRPETFSGTSMMILYPLMFASNILVDPGTMPGWIGRLVELNPISLVVTAVRGHMEGTAGGGEIAAGLGVCLVMIAVFAPLTFYYYLTKPLR